MPPTPRTTRVVQLAALPEGLPRPEHFRVVEVPVPVPADGEVLVRNRYFQVFPALRTLIGGGEQLRAAITAARPGARFVLVGTLEGQLAADRTGTTAPVEIDTFQLIAKRIEMRGFGGLDDAGERPEWAERFGAWLRSGDITFPHARVAGIEQAPRALHELIGGRHLGAVVVEL